MNTHLIQLVRKLSVACATTLVLVSAANAAEHVIVIPDQATQRGSAFVFETVIRNVQTGERTVVSEECVARAGTVPTLECIQIAPDPSGRKWQPTSMRDY